MADIQRVPIPAASQPQPIPEALHVPSASTAPLTIPSPPNRIRNSYLGLDVMSPVNQNGSFEFDRVLKSGFVQKRTRKTKTWKQIFLVLRPNSLSIYKDEHEEKLRHKINLADLTAVALLKDPKQRRQNVFGLFSSSRNYHLEAASKKDAEQWVDLIRQEARVEEEEEEMLLASPGANTVGTFQGLERTMQEQNESRRLDDERVGSSSPEPSDLPPRPARSEALPPGGQRRASHTIEYSGTDLASQSDMSDMEPARARDASKGTIPETSVTSQPQSNQPPSETLVPGARNISQMSGFSVEVDPERVVWQGHLLYLKSKGGVRQWKDLWVVIRAKNFALYKNESEYSPVLIIPLSSVINAVEIDPISRTKRNCLQVITEEKSYKFCAHNEGDLDKSLGAFKSLLAKRKEHEAKTNRAR